MIELKCEGCGTITTAIHARQIIHHAACPNRKLGKGAKIPRYLPPTPAPEVNVPLGEVMDTPRRPNRRRG